MGRPAQLNASGTDITVVVYHVEGATALVELRQDVPVWCEEAYIRNKIKGEVVTVPLPALRFMD